MFFVLYLLSKIVCLSARPVLLPICYPNTTIHHSQVALLILSASLSRGYAVSLKMCAFVMPAESVEIVSERWSVINMSFRMEIVEHMLTSLLVSPIIYRALFFTIVLTTLHPPDALTSPGRHGRAATSHAGSRLCRFLELDSGLARLLLSLIVAKDGTENKRFDVGDAGLAVVDLVVRDAHVEFGMPKRWCKRVSIKFAGDVRWLMT